jgi:hypothetical protein
MSPRASAAACKSQNACVLSWAMLGTCSGVIMYYVESGGTAPSRVTTHSSFDCKVKDTGIYELYDRDHLWNLMQLS